MEVITTFELICYFLIASAFFTFFSLFWITAPYGRHERTRWGLSLPNSWGWVLMESPGVVMFSAVFFRNGVPQSKAALFFYCLWFGHYFYRAAIFPFRLKTKGRSISFSIVAMGFLFNCLNAYVNAFAISSPSHTSSYSLNFSVVLGLMLFVGGFYTHFSSDNILINLRANSTGYKIPNGKLFTYVSSPNYLGEIVEWIGWALLTQNLAATVFAIYTFANLAPRSLSNHSWYKREFSNYPQNRKALIPFVI